VPFGLVVDARHHHGQPFNGEQKRKRHDEADNDAGQFLLDRDPQRAQPDGE